MKRIRTGAALALALGALAAGCGSSGSTASTGPTSPSAAAAAGAGGGAGAGAGGGGGIHVAHTSIGSVLVDRSGLTLYMLTADSKGHSSCSATCQATWPPTAPSTGMHVPGVMAALGRASTPDGKPIATIAGTPLYTYSGDSAPGDVNGEGIHSYGGTWYAVSPAGHGIRNGSGSSSGGSGGGSGGSSGGGYGAGY